MDDLVDSNSRERNTRQAPLPKLRPLETQPLGYKISAFLDISESPRYLPMAKAISNIEKIHGIDPISIDGIFDKDLGLRTEGGYLANTDFKVKSGAFFFNTRKKISQIAAVEEMAHCYDHQLFSYTNNWASESGESQISDILNAIKASPTYQVVAKYGLGQRVLLIKGDRTEVQTIMNQEDLKYEQDLKEWFARAYIQFIAISSGDEELLKEIAALRSTSTHVLLYPAAWADDEFEAIAQSFEALLRNKRWLR